MILGRRVKGRAEKKIQCDFCAAACNIGPGVLCTAQLHNRGTATLHYCIPSGWDIFSSFSFFFFFSLFLIHRGKAIWALTEGVKMEKQSCLSAFQGFCCRSTKQLLEEGDANPSLLDATLPNYMQPSQVYFFTHSFINWCWTFQVNRTPDTSCATQEISRKSSKRRKGHLFHRKTAKTAGAISGRNRAFQTPTLLFDSRLWTQISPFQVPLPLSKLSPSPLESKPCSKRVPTAQSCSWTRPKPPGLGSEMRRSSRISDNCENLLRGFKWLTLLIHQARQRGQWMPIAQYQVLHSSVQPERKKGKTKA